MALFFDQAWFDARLAANGKTREDVARLLRLSGEEVAELWKDQRELKASEVSALATLINATTAEVANRAGVSTPAPDSSLDVKARLDEMSERLTRIERMIVELKTLVLASRP